MRQLFFCISLVLFLSGFSQKDNQKNALFTIRGNIGIPIPVSSKAFHTSFAGLYEANLSFNLRLFSNFYAGVGYQNSFFQSNKFLKQQLFNTSVPYNTDLMGNGIFFKLGYDKFFSDKGYFSYSLNAGYMICNYSDINADTSAPNRPYQPHKFTAPYLQPEVSANFIVDQRLSFSFMLAYTTLFYHFDPRAPRFNQFDEIGHARNRYLMSWLSIGAGFNVLINTKTTRR